MRKFSIVLAILLFCGFLVSGAKADTVLQSWAFNLDGSTYQHITGTDGNSFSILPGSVNYASFNQTTGLGTLTWTISGAGVHTFSALVDHEISQSVNTWWNEYGAWANAPVTGQSWQLDNPDYGSIFSNTLAGTLSNFNRVTTLPQDLDGDGIPDEHDVSMALGWNFALAADETATITLLLDSAAPASGFYLTQIDPASRERIYFSSSLQRETGPGTEPVPEPTTFLLLASGLAGLLGFRRKFGK